LEGDPAIRIERDAIGSTLITGDRNIVIQFGLTSAPARFRGRVQRFLSYYLGSESRPAPFGGRGAQLGQLGAWLADPDAPSNFLITAPAGRGKTALLVHWLQSVDAAAWPVAFVPISIRFGTNRPDIFYQALAARLAEVMGQEVDDAGGDAAEVYKDRVIEQLDAIAASGKRCLVLIDGLDEATGWQVDTTVLPPESIPGLRFIASARLVGGASTSEDWLVRLGWRAGDTRAFELPALDRDGIADVLREMGVPLADLAGDVDLLSELERLTEGDPLLLRFYVEDLWENRDKAAGLRPEELRGRQKGFAAYFRDWLSRQGGIYLTKGAPFDEQTIKAILVVLACALGPLRLADVVHLVHRLLGPGRFITSDDLEPIKRFLIGGGSDESGYALGHPKLGEYLLGDFFGASEDIARAQGAFLAWGKDTVSALNAETLEPEKTPLYLLQHYVQHLEESTSDLDGLYALVEDGCRRAWQVQREGGFQGFTNDVHLVWTAIRRALLSPDCNAECLSQGVGGAVRCALCMSSIWSLGVNVPAPLLAACLKHKILSSSQATHFAELRDDPLARAEAFAAIAPLLEESGRAEALLQSLEAVRQIRNSDHKAKALSTLGPHLGPELLSPAIQIAEYISDPAERADMLSFLELKLESAGEKIAYFDRAVRLLDNAKNNEKKALVLAGIALHRDNVGGDLPTPEDLIARARAAVEGIKDEYERVKTLVQLASCLLDRDGEMLTKAITAASKATSAKARAYAFPHLISLLESDDDRRPLLENQALAAARALPREADRAPTLGLVAWSLGNERGREVLDEALAEARRCNESVRATNLTYLSQLCEEDERTMICEEILEIFAKTPSRWALGYLAPFLQPEYLRRALDVALLISDEKPRISTLRRLFQELPPGEREDLVNYAVTLVNEFKAHDGALGDLLKLAPFLNEVQREGLLKESMTLDGEPVRINLLVSLAPYLSTDQLQQASTAIKAVSNPLLRVAGLLRLARYAGDGKHDWIADGDLTAALHRDVPGDLELLIEISQLLPEDKRLWRARCLVRALKVAWETGYAGSRAINVCRVLPLLPTKRRRPNLLRVLAEAMPSGSDLDELMQSLFPTLAKEMPETAVAVARELKTPGLRARALALVAPELDPRQCDSLMREAFANATTLPHHGGIIVASFARDLPDDLLPDALDKVQSILHDEEDRSSHSLAIFAHQVREPYRTLAEESVLSAALQIENHSRRAYALASMLPLLSEDRPVKSSAIKGALSAALQIEDHTQRTDVLIRMLPHLSGDQLVRSLLDITGCWFRVNRSKLLQQLETVVPSLTEVGGTRSIRSAALAVHDTAEWWP
jgi:hypothetical protein